MDFEDGLLFFICTSLMAIVLVLIIEDCIIRLGIGENKDDV